MKKLIILMGALMYLYSNDTKDILRMMDSLNKINFQYKEVQTIYNPFVKKTNNNIVTKTKIKTTKTTKVNTSYNLEVIFQNKARINNKWYKNNDKLDKYIIIIKNQKVYLKSKNSLIQIKRKTLIRVKQ